MSAEEFAELIIADYWCGTAAGDRYCITHMVVVSMGANNVVALDLLGAALRRRISGQKRIEQKARLRGLYEKTRVTEISKTHR